MRSMKDARPRALLGLVLIVAGIVALAVSGNLSIHETRFAVFYGLSLAGFALLATAARTLPLRGAILAAVVLRLVLLPGTPTLSDDFYRFAWDGRVQLSGINPYEHPPADSALDDVAYSDRDDVDFAGLRTVQMEPSGMSTIDTALHLRGNCALCTTPPHAHPVARAWAARSSSHRNSRLKKLESPSRVWYKRPVSFRRQATKADDSLGGCVNPLGESPHPDRAPYGRG